MDAITFLRELVSIRSYSGQEAEVAQFLVGSMNDLGFKSFIDEVGNAVGTKSSPDQNGQISREIVLLGHMDTVPGDIRVQEKNGRLYGRGTVDAKGPLAVFVQAATKARLSPGTRVIVVGAVEEESATSRGARHVAQTYSPDWCIIGEPSGFDSLTLGYKGRLLINYHLSQPMGHTAGPNTAVGEKAITWWNNLEDYVQEFNRDRPRLFEQLLLSLRDFNTSSDGLENQAKLKVGLRLPPGFDPDHLENVIHDWTNGGELEFFGFEPAYRSPRRTSLTKAFNRALSQQGIRTRLKVKTGTSDMNVVGPVWHCPIVAYGPGDSKLDHTPEEHIDLEEYSQAIKILESVLTNEGV